MRVGKARLQIRGAAKTRGRRRNKSGGGTSIEVDIRMQMGSKANKKRDSCAKSKTRRKEEKTTREIRMSDHREKGQNNRSGQHRGFGR